MRRKGELSPVDIDRGWVCLQELKVTDSDLPQDAIQRRRLAASGSDQLADPCGNHIEDISHDISIAAARTDGDVKGMIGIHGHVKRGPWSELME
jgi:hypothetical protein